jgi:alpha-beta hydrolase superfamily lysophospholipase
MRWFLLIAVLLLLTACTGGGVKEEVTLATEDGAKIAATYYPGGERGVILLHMLGRNRGDYTAFAQELQKRGFSVIAIDLRGHGSSSGDWRSFSASDFNTMVLDVKAAKEYLLGMGVKPGRIGIVGASIGANIALRYAAEDSEIKTVVLLSPGLNYRGVVTDDAAARYSRSVLFAASEEDAYAFSSAEQLYSLVKGEKVFERLSNAGHGTEMLSASPELRKKVIAWLEARL